MDLSPDASRGIIFVPLIPGEAGDRQGRQECEGEREERGGNLQDICDRLTERFRESVARRIDGLRDAVQSLGQALRRVPELKEAVQEQFREWREAIRERFTGQPYHRELEDLSGGRDGSGGGRGTRDEPERGGWER